ncbi:MAG: winged helix-turn-helix domain-containing protein, partial [Ilumatobacter sp.]|nr:winged helix-turn-helix domain-containing protein [Ilumatobacter sp.]
GNGSGVMTTEPMDVAALSAATKRILNGQYNGKPIPQVLMSLIHGMIRADLRLHEISTYLHTADVTLARDLRTFYEGDLSAEIEIAFEKAKEWRNSFTKACDQARGIAAQGCRGGQKESTALAVLFGLYDLAEARGAFSFTTSVRAIGEAAGVGAISDSGRTTNQTAVFNGLQTLTKHGLADVVIHSATSLEIGRTQIKLRAPARLLELLDSQPQNPLTLLLWSPKIDSVTSRERGEWVIKISGTKSCTPIGLHSTWRHVIWENAGLGMTAGRLWHLALQEPSLSTRQLADRLGISLQATKTQLSKLATEGLYDTANSRPIELDQGGLDGVAVRLGVDDRRATRTAINDQNRAEFVDFLRSEPVADHRTHRSWTPQASSLSSAQVGTEVWVSLLDCVEHHQRGVLLADPGFGPFDGPNDDLTPVETFPPFAAQGQFANLDDVPVTVTVTDIAPATTAEVQAACGRAVEARIARLKSDVVEGATAATVMLGGTAASVEVAA